MHPYRIPVWKAAPFTRLLLPLIAGIILQWYLEFSFIIILLFLLLSLLIFSLLHFFSLALRYKLRSLTGFLLNCIIAGVAMLLTWQHDVRHDKKWFGHYYHDSEALLVRLAEPLTAKSRSYKCEGIIEAVYDNGKAIAAVGKILIYLSKDSISSSLNYGDKIIINQPLQQVRNSGNPGAFNYERYTAFQQVFHNVFLKGDEVVLLKQKNINLFWSIIFSSQKYIIDVLQKNLPDNKNITGIAEALLIGYKEDLDKDLVQAYSNTGVVHIIAISGLHLGLIYVMLVWLFDRLPLIKRSRFLKVLLILGSLWFFSLLTGASASVLRSAVMFTCIVIGKNYFTQSSIYNSLAASAFLLLAYNPYFLWDVGFQLSYLAVIGIVWLQQPIYRSLYVKSKQLDKLWNMIAVTLAAQVITFPICIYYFHQFPNLFLITNLLAVPLSTVILFAEILLIACSWVNIIAVYAGKLVSLLVWLMNIIIQTCDSLPFSRMDNIYANMLSTWLLYMIVISCSYWMIYRQKTVFLVMITSLFAFTMFLSFEKFRLSHQRRIIVYNIPKHQAIDFISGNKYFFCGDTVLQKDGMLQNFHLKPARVSMSLDKTNELLPGLMKKNNYWSFFGKKILIVDSSVIYEPTDKKLTVDILLISNNPALKISGLITAIQPSIIIFDCSNSLWKIANWKKECIALALPCFSIPEQGAFVLDI